MNKDETVGQIGVDCHRKFSTVSARDGTGGIMWRDRLEHEDRRPLRRRLRTWPEGTPIVLEATFGWGWLADELLAAGLEPHLASSRKVAAWRQARGMAKSNRTDADLLSELWNQQPRWWEVWLAPPEVRDRREWLRYRMVLVTMQTGLKCRIHAVLHRHGIVHGYSDLFGAGGRKFLGWLTAPNDQTLRKSAKATLKGYLQLLDHTRRQMARVTREFRQQVVKSQEGDRLRMIPGISWILAYTILAEVGDIRRFRKIFDRHTCGGKRNRGRGYIVVAHELCRVGFAVWTKETDYTDTRPPRPGRLSKGKRSHPGTGRPVGLMVAAAG